MKRLFLVTVLCISFMNSQGQTLEKDLTIGTKEDKVFFGLIQSIDVDSERTIYVSDWVTKNIRIFNFKGGIKDTIGHQGKGPGEFQKLDGSGLNKQGLLYAYDPNLIRVSIFDVESSNLLLKTLNIPKLQTNMEYGAKPRDIFVFNQGNFLLKYSTPYSPGTGSMKRKKKFVLFNKKGEVVKQPLLTLREDQKLVQDQGGGLSVGPMPFGRRSLLEIGPADRIYTAWTGKLEINIFNKRGSLIKTFSDDITPISVSNSDFQKANEKYSFQLSNFTSEIPDSWPAFDWFEVDDRSRVWVAVNTKDRNKYSLKIYDQQGKKIAQTKLPKRVELKEIRDGYAYGINRGEQGLQSVIRYKINGLNEE